jgi:Tol biopolymer transport system component
VNGRAHEVWKGGNGALLEPPAVSTDGRRIAIILRQNGRLHLNIISADGAEIQPIAEMIDVRGTACWSPDGAWIVVGGNSAEGPGLFKIPSAGGQPVRIVRTVALNPVWEPDGRLIAYSGANVGPTAPLLAVHPDGAPVDLPTIKVRVQGERYRFLPNGTSLVYMQGISPSQDFWMLDPATKKMRQLTKLKNTAAMRTFDVTPDGKQIVFDRLRDNSDVVLIDIPQ